MLIRPVTEKEAEGETKENYILLRESLNLPYVPLFFTFLGPFPEYLTYVTKQLVNNLKHPDFQTNVRTKSFEIRSDIRQSLIKNEKVEDWLRLYIHSPSFFYFQQDLSRIFVTNVKLAYIFVGLREALKGWAIAAKKLTGKTVSEKKSAVKDKFDEEQLFVFDNFLPSTGVQEKPSQQYGNGPRQRAAQSIIKTSSPSIEKALLPEYLHLCRENFISHMKTDDFWQLRVRVEETILTDLHNLPDVIFSPINIVLRLTGKYDQFPDLLFLLAEHFPTYAVQRMIFSGFMME